MKCAADKTGDASNPIRRGRVGDRAARAPDGDGDVGGAALWIAAMTSDAVA